MNKRRMLLLFVVGSALTMLVGAYTLLPAVTGLLFAQPIVVVTNPFIAGAPLSPSLGELVFIVFAAMSVYALIGGVIFCGVVELLLLLVRRFKQKKRAAKLASS
jgi:hypothetical protein